MSDIPDATLLNMGWIGRGNDPLDIIDSLVAVPLTDAVGITDTY